MTLVAEGDSWFDYPPGKDILDYLQQDFHYRVIKLSDAGDTLENMAWGTALDRRYRRKPPQSTGRRAILMQYQPEAFLLSGGGNDLAGPQFGMLLNHAAAFPDQPLRLDMAHYICRRYLGAALGAILKEVWSVSPSTHVFIHGYGYPIADGRAVFNLPGGMKLFGAWLKPELAARGISEKDGTRVLRTLIDLFNDMLRRTEAASPRFHYVDLRPHITPEDWINELHVSNSCYRRLAGVFHRAIQRVFTVEMA